MCLSIFRSCVVIQIRTNIPARIVAVILVHAAALVSDHETAPPVETGQAANICSHSPSANSAPRVSSQDLFAELLHNDSWPWQEPYSAELHLSALTSARKIRSQNTLEESVRRGCSKTLSAESAPDFSSRDDVRGVNSQMRGPLTRNQ